MSREVVSVTIGLLYFGFFMYLWYKVLNHIHATELMWFLFVLLIPLGIALTIIEKGLKNEQ